MYILDTDHLTILERGGIIAVKLRAKLANISPEEIAVTIITYFAKIILVLVQWI